MINKNRNLAQKWRAKTFAQIIGQPLSVRMLQNSLYANRIFPVYLFSGNRGCGKTSMARIFAAALNCHKLDAFRQEPKTQVLPCLMCDSCLAMSNHEHPDFIEMDAASHTGVDNVRDIIDAASLVPVLGRMRIYLLDEAHMLSKAAFNAFLKVLEEPPMSVVFILATTDPQKIIDTVRSRCFNVFFNPVEQEALVAYLKTVCAQEGIEADESGLGRIAQNAQGCVRDALTLIEQVWYAHARITNHTVAQTLNAVNDSLIITLVQALSDANTHATLSCIAQLGMQYDALQLLHAIAMALRLTIWYQLGIAQTHSWYQDQSFLNLVQQAPQARLIYLLQQAADVELVLIKAINKRICLEAFLLRMCDNTERKSSRSGNDIAIPIEKKEFDNNPIKSEQIKTSVEQPIESQPIINSPWQQFMALIQQKGDNLLYSIFKQARCLSVDEDSGQLDMVLPDSLLLFKDMIDNHKLLWSDCLQQVYGKPIAVTIIFDAQAPVVELKPIQKNPPTPSSNQAPSNIKKNNYGQQAVKQKQVLLDVSDANKWQKTALVLEFFPGTVTKIGEAS